VIILPQLRGALSARRVGSGGGGSPGGSPGGGGSPTDGDPYFSDVVLLLHFGGSHGSTTFTNSATRGPATVTAAGAASISTTQSKFGGSSFRPGAGYIWYASGGADHTFAVADEFTMEWWQRADTVTADQYPFMWNNNRWGLYSINPGKPKWIVDSTNRITGADNLIIVDTWQFISYTRIIAGGPTYTGVLHVDGVNVGTWTDNFGWGQSLCIGAYDKDTALNFQGYIDEVRVTKGVARYTTSNYTPPTAAFPDSPP